MSEPVRITRCLAKASKMPPNTVSVCRPGAWGNPFRVGHPATLFPGEAVITTTTRIVRTPELAVAMFRAWMLMHEELVTEAKKQLRGKNLACFCAQLACSNPSCEVRIILNGWVGLHCPMCGSDLVRVPCHADVLLEIANS